LLQKSNDNHILQGVVEEKSMIRSEVDFIHTLNDMDSKNTWIPAYAGMTGERRKPERRK